MLFSVPQKIQQLTITPVFTVTYRIMNKKRPKNTAVIDFFLIIALCLNLGVPIKVHAKNVPGLPLPGKMVQKSPEFEPALLQGIRINKENAFELDFIVTPGDEKKSQSLLNNEAKKLIKYFLAGLTIPQDDIWVNLSPYEKNRIAPEKLGQTEMGRDLLAQDYILKQLSSSLIHPDEGLGKSFWDNVYSQAFEKFGTTEVPLNTFNKIWIIPEKAIVYQQDNAAIIVESKLKVMMEEDYVAMKVGAGPRACPLSSEHTGHPQEGAPTEIFRTLLLPAIEKEINTGKNFANLRQIYNSLILASWYKKSLKQSALTKAYADKNKINGVDVYDKNIKEKIYAQYLDAFKQGAFNFIKEEYNNLTNNITPRKYFAGGVVMGKPLDMAMIVVEKTENVGIEEMRNALLYGINLTEPKPNINESIEPLNKETEVFTNDDFMISVIENAITGIIQTDYPGRDVIDMTKNLTEFVPLSDEDDEKMFNMYQDTNTSQQFLAFMVSTVFYTLAESDESKPLTALAQILYQYIEHMRKPLSPISTEVGMAQKTYINALNLIAKKMGSSVTLYEIINDPLYSAYELLRSSLLSSSHHDNETTLRGIANDIYADIIFRKAQIVYSYRHDGNLIKTREIKKMPPAFHPEEPFSSVEVKAALNEAMPEPRAKPRLQELPELFSNNKAIMSAGVVATTALIIFTLNTFNMNREQKITQDKLFKKPDTGETPSENFQIPELIEIFDLELPLTEPFIAEPKPLLIASAYSENQIANDTKAHESLPPLFSDDIENIYAEATELMWNLFPRLNRIYNKDAADFMLELHAIGMTESELDSNGKSIKNANGIMQVRRIAWDETINNEIFKNAVIKRGENWEYTPKNFSDPRKNILVAAFHFAFWGTYEEDMTKNEMRYIYNAGWHKIVTEGHVPQESLRYAKKIIRNRNLLQEIAALEQAGVSLLRLEDNDTLWDIAQGNMQYLEILIRVNRISSDGKVKAGQIIRFPEKGEIFILNLHSTLQEIAEQTGHHATDLMEFNGLQLSHEQIESDSIYSHLPNGLIWIPESSSKTTAKKKKSFDKAMFTKGGIDLNERFFNMDIQSNGKPISSSINFENTQDIQINGLEPSILSVGPLDLSTFLNY